MPNKERYTFYTESEKLNILKSVYTRSWGDLPRVLRAAMDAVLDGLATEPNCPNELKRRIQLALANGEDNTPPRPLFPAPETRAVPRLSCRDCGHQFIWSGADHDFQTCDCPDGQRVSVDFNDEFCMRTIGDPFKLIRHED